jgi:hypothetical protein
VYHPTIRENPCGIAAIGCPGPVPMAETASGAAILDEAEWATFVQQVIGA